MRRTYGGYAADIWRIYSGHTADMQRIYGGFTADGRQICGGHTADIRQAYGGHVADMRRTCGVHAPVRLADICHFDVTLSFSFHCIRHDISLGGRGFPNDDAS